MDNVPQKKNRFLFMDVTKGPIAGAVLAGVVIAAFVLGVFIGEFGRPATTADNGGTGKVTGVGSRPPSKADADFGEFWDVWRLVHEQYVDKVDDRTLFYGAIKGMVGSLHDPHSVYFDPELAKKFADELDGTFQGIGAEIGIKQDALTIVAPLPRTPAERAGLKAGDFILKIDGVDTSDMLLDEAVSRIRGPKDSTVTLTVFRKGWEEPREIKIVRAQIIVDPVRWHMVVKSRKKFAVIELSQFNDNSASKFREAVRSALLESPDGVILDLRNNPGGLLPRAVEISGEWVDNDLVVTEKYSDGTQDAHRSRGEARLKDVPTVVLVNEGSASASEIVAGALQDYGKAKLVGKKTYGKGSVQNYIELNDGSALKITVAKWYTPKDRSIDKLGIAPDIEVDRTEEDYNNDKDPQLDKAFEVLLGTAK